MTDAAPSSLFAATTESPNHRRRSTRLLARSVGQEQIFAPAASRSLSDDEGEGEEEEQQQQNATVTEPPWKTQASRSRIKAIYGGRSTLYRREILGEIADEAEAPQAALQFTTPTGHLAFWIFLGMLAGALVSVFTPFRDHYIVLSDGWRFTLDALLTLMSVAYLVGLCYASIMK